MENNIINKPESLQERFEYELKDWKYKLGSNIVELIKTGDHSGSYEIETMHIFKLENGQYATVIESGCSCYDPSWAKIDILRDEQSAKDQFVKWDKENKGNED